MRLTIAETALEQNTQFSSTESLVIRKSRQKNSEFKEPVMEYAKKFASLALGCSLLCAAMSAQRTEPVSANTVVPQLVNVWGQATDMQGKPISGVAGAIFAVYKDEFGGAPLWLESQNIQAGWKGNFSVQLGAATSGGVPLQLFASGEARWLGIRINGGEEQARVLLVSVPYALKAADAQTLGGLPPSAFVLAAPGGGNSGTALPSSPSSSSPQTTTPPVGGSGTQNYVPLWTDSTGDLGNSILYQVGSGSKARIGINEKSPLFTLDVNGQELVRGLFEMATQNYATPTKAYNSQPFNLESSAYNSGTSKYTLNHFQWQAEPTGNNTATPGATLNLLYGTDPAAPAETGLQLSSTGLFTFASGQTFPGTGTITGVTTAAGSGLTGGGTTGNLTLSLTNSCSSNQVLQWSGTAWVCTTIVGGGTITGVTAGTDLTGGGTSGSVTLNLDTTKVPQLSAANTFKGDQSVVGNVSVATGYGFNIGGVPFAFGSLTGLNASLGFAGNSTMTGTGNTASGVQALSANTTGFNNTAHGAQSLFSNTIGVGNAAFGVSALRNNISGNNNTASGENALGANTTGGNNTANGLDALRNNTTASVNTATGTYSLFSNTTGPENTATGYAALYSNTTGFNNTATGLQALYSNTVGVGNAALGVNTLFSNTTGSNNTASGEKALYANTTGGNNTATGLDALSANTTASENTATGTYALFSNDVGADNTAVGFAALYTNNSVLASYNTAMGAYALHFNTDGSANTATGYEAMYNNSIGFWDTAVGYQAMYNANGSIENTAVGYQALYSDGIGDNNTGVGYNALHANNAGRFNTAYGAGALAHVTSSSSTGIGYEALVESEGGENVAVGYLAAINLTVGDENTAVGAESMGQNINGQDITCIGFGCSSDNNLKNSTAIGAHAVVGQSNSLVLGGTGQWAVNVGIGTTTPSSILTIARGAGHPVSDSWETYSSRRWKTNIQTLPDALAKVEQLRGVSYDLKDSGKHEVGVIAEEVGKVVPEVVTYEANGKDARGVDYSRLTALLIEAVKQQQKQIAVQGEQIRKMRSKNALLESKLSKLQGSVNQLRQAKKVGSESASQTVAATLQY